MKKQESPGFSRGEQVNIVYRVDGREVTAEAVVRALCIAPLLVSEPATRSELQRAVSAVRTRQPHQAAHILAVLGITFERTTP